MKAHRLRLLALPSFMVFGACAAETETQPKGLAIEVAPLELPGIGQACYDIEVNNLAGGAGDTVWSKGTPGHQTGSPDEVLTGDPDAVCSGQYGNNIGGDITYIGPCDADGDLGDADADGERWNSVTIWFDGLYDDNDVYIDPDGEDGWEDPCPNGCTIDFLCEENADTLAEFNFTVLRQAEQGFFDIIVNFKDVFCSGKYDTCYDSADADEDGDTEPMELLFGDGDVDGPGRDYTGVLALACTGGVDGDPQPDGSPAEPGGPNTILSYSQVFVRCYGPTGAETFVIDADEGAGQHTAVSSPSGVKMQFAIYQDAEELDCGDATSQHLYDAVYASWVYGDDGEYYAYWENGGWALYAYADDSFIGAVEGDPATPPDEFFIANTSYPAYFTLIGPSCNKNFLNFAFNLEDLAGYNCSLQAQATAQSDDDIVLGPDGLLAAANSTHPIINVAIKNMAECQENPLNGDGSHMSTFYTSNFVGGAWAHPLCFHFNGTNVSTLKDVLATFTSDKAQYADARLSKELIGRFGRAYAQRENCNGTFNSVRNNSEYQYYMMKADAGADAQLAITQTIPTDVGIDGERLVQVLNATTVDFIQYSVSQKRVVETKSFGARALPAFISYKNLQANDALIIGYRVDKQVDDVLKQLRSQGYKLEAVPTLVGE